MREVSRVDIVTGLPILLSLRSNLALRVLRLVVVALAAGRLACVTVHCNIKGRFLARDEGSLVGHRGLLRGILLG